jgi:subtilisin-like proprotein convertase family protein
MNKYVTKIFLKQLLLAVATLVALAENEWNCAAQSTFANQAPITINDSTNPPTKASPYPVPNWVVGMPGFITGLSVTLSNVNHTYADDIGVLLVGSNGQGVILMANAGGSTGLTNVNLTFSDFAASSLPDQMQISSSTFKPTAFGSHIWPAPAPAGPYVTNLSVFNGMNPNGQWNLYVMDDAHFDSGNIAKGWWLTVVTATNLPPKLSEVAVTPVIGENSIATLAGKISDLDTNNSFTLSVNWGDSVSNQNVSLPAGTTNFTLTHLYLDDGQTGTPSDNYQIAVTLTDSGGTDDDGFLSALFQDVLGRPFNPLERSTYQTLMFQVGRDGVAHALLTSFEYRSKQIQSYYQRFLHRAASQVEINSLAQSALSEKDIVATLLASAEYFSTRAGNDNNAWLDAVFYDVLQRGLTAGERNIFFVYLIQNGRAAVVWQLQNGLPFEQSLVESRFQKYLHRAAGADAGPYLNALLTLTWEEVAAQVLGSSEYYSVRSGGTDSAAVGITVTNTPPVLSNISIASPILEGGITSLTGQCNDTCTNDTFMISVDWGDGSPVQSVPLAVGAKFFNVAHLYSVPHKTNLVQVTLTDDDLGATTQTVSVIVDERAPRITSIQRQPGNITRLDCLGVPARTYTVQASTNVISPTNWVTLGSATATANGTFTNFDMPPGNLLQRFYRLRSP